MNFLALLAALAAEQVLGGWRDDARPAVLTPLWQLIRPRHAVGVALLVAIPAALACLIDWELDGHLLQPLFAGCVLFACLGPRDLDSVLQRLMQARADGDKATAERLTRALQSGPAPDANHRSLFGALFIQSHERLFGVLLWFILFGPGGAVAYRIASRLPCELENDAPALPAADTLHALLAYVPARITAMLFGLAGSLDQALASWRVVQAEPHPDWRRHTWSLLAESSAAALDVDAPDGPAVAISLDSCLREVLRIQSRALLLLLAADALIATGTLFA